MILTGVCLLALVRWVVFEYQPVLGFHDYTWSLHQRRTESSFKVSLSAERFGLGPWCDCDSPPQRVSHPMIRQKEVERTWESWEAGNSEGELRMASGSKYLRERTKSSNVGCVWLFLTSIPNEGGSFEKLNFYLFWGGRKVARAAWETGRWASLLGLAQRHSPHLKGQCGTRRGKFWNVEISSV